MEVVNAGFPLLPTEKRRLLEKQTHRKVQLGLKNRMIVCRANESESQLGQQQLNSESWKESCKLLTALGMSTEEGNKVLSKAFGYAKSAYWGEQKQAQVVSKETVDKILQYLINNIGLTGSDTSTLLIKFPEVLGCDLDEEVKKNVEILDLTWGIDGNMLRKLLLRNPQVLGYNVDCKGDCMAQCTRCWARF